MRNRILPALLCILLIYASVPAGSLDKKEVAADAKWVLHLDLDAFRDSQLGTLVLDKIHSTHQDQIDAMKELLGLDLTADIHSLTGYGTDADEKTAVALFHGSFDKEKMLALLKLNEHHTTMDYNDHTIHLWAEDKSNKAQAGTFITGDLIAISQSEESVKKAIDVVNTKVASLDSNRQTPLFSLTDRPGRPILLLAVDSLSELTDDDTKAAVLKNSKMLAVLAAEDDGQLSLSIELVTENTEAATQIEQIIRGMIAFATLEAKKKPALEKILSNLSLMRTDNLLNLNFSYPSADLFELLQSADDLDIDFDMGDFDADLDLD